MSHAIAVATARPTIPDQPTKAAAMERSTDRRLSRLRLFADHNGQGNLVFDLLGIVVDAPLRAVNVELATQCQAAVVDPNGRGKADFPRDAVHRQLAGDLMLSARWRDLGRF